MDAKVIAKTVIEGVTEKLPSMIEVSVSEQTSEIKEAVETQGKEIADLTSEVKTLAETTHMQVKTVKEANLEEAMEKVGTYLKALKKEGHKNAVKEVQEKFLNEGTDADGGFLVPEEFWRTVYSRLDKAGVVRRHCTVLPMQTDTLDLQRVATGITVGYIGEGIEYGYSEPTFARTQLIAKKVGAISTATLELIGDNMSDQDIWNIVTEQATNAIMLFEDSQILTGDGTGSNVDGVLNKAGTVGVTMPATKTAFADVAYSDLIAMVYDIDTKNILSDGNLKRFGHRSILGILRSITDDQNRPVLEYVGEGPNQSALVLGYEFIDTSVMPGKAATAVDTAFLAFGDLKGFFVGDRMQMTFDTGYKTGDWEKDLQSLKVTQRFDAELVFPGGISVLKTAAA